jgi:hypothetical protein
LTAALTLVFSAVVPDWETRDKAFFACALFSIGYLRLSGSAKDLAGISFRDLVVSLAIWHPIPLVVYHENCAKRAERDHFSPLSSNLHLMPIAAMET